LDPDAIESSQRQSIIAAAMTNIVYLIMIKNRLIPFSWLPASWGLAGPAREQAEAYYTLDGYDLALRLAEIHYEGEALTRKKAMVRHEHGAITDYEYEVELANLITDDVERKVALLDIDMRYGTIDAIEADKDIATLRGEPWIRVVNDGLDKEEGPNGYYFEFDWNQIWIDMLQEAGYVGPTDEAIVQSWFQELCRQTASESMGAPPINGGIVYG
jgi:hypothetical protein